MPSRKKMLGNKIPPVTSLPSDPSATGPVVWYNGKAWLWRWVVELNSSDDYLRYPIPQTIGNGWAIEKTFKDLNEVASTTILYCIHNGLSDRFIQITYEDNQVSAYYRDSDNVIHYTGAVAITPNEISTIRLEISDNTLILSCGGNSASVAVDLLKTRAFTEAGCYFFEASALPFYVCCFKQFESSILIDKIPCTEPSGTNLSNTTTPSRPATLSDGTAHAQTWVPLS